MSMSVRCEGCGLEYAGARRLRRPVRRSRATWPGRATCAMLAEVPRFHRHARRGCWPSDERRPATSDPGRVPGRRRLLALLRRALHDCRWSPRCGPAGRRSRAAATRPATCSRSSTTTGCSRSAARRAWRTVVGGSRRYVERVAEAADRGARRHPGARGRAARPTASRSATTPTTAHRFDAVVIATHPDQALALLADPTARRTRGARARSATPATTTWLHTDTSVLPRRAGARASWNYLKPACAPAPAPVAGQLRHEPAAAAGRARPTTWSRSTAPDRLDRARVLATDGLRAPGLHAGVGRRAAPAARAERRHAAPSPAPTTAGASTRTAAAPGSRGRGSLGVRLVSRRVPGRRARCPRCTTPTSCTPAGSHRGARSRHRHLPVAGRPGRAAGAARWLRPFAGSRRATTSATRPAAIRANLDALPGRRRASTCTAAGCSCWPTPGCWATCSTR